MLRQEKMHFGRKCLPLSQYSFFHSIIIASPMYTFESLPLDRHLLQLAERGNLEFTRRLHPGVEGVLGIRMADLRNLARRIARQDAAAYLQAVENTPEAEQSPYMEARTLHGLVLGYIKPTSVDDYLAHVARWVPRINSWSVCDAFQLADVRRLLAEHNDRIWDFAGERLDSEHEYTVRFAVVLLMLYFIEADHITAVVDRLCAVRHEGYYVRMAVAWAVAECYIRFPEHTLPVFEQHRLPLWTHNKALQKIRESLRPDEAVKVQLQALKRKV